MRILVTGAAGFIGSNLCARLLSEEHEVLGIDNFDDFYDPSQKRANLQGLEGRPGWELREVDILERERLEETVRGVDAVIHLAARAGVRPSFDRPALYASVNVAGTGNLIECCLGAGVSRFIFGSSSSVYGEGAEVPFRESRPLGEPKSPYAATKVAGEALLGSFRERFESLTILRFFTVYGPAQRPDLAIHKFARRILAGEPIPVFGPTSSYRDYTYVDDIVDGVVRALRTNPRWAVLNLASGAPITLEDMITGLEDALGRRAVRLELPPQEGDLAGTWADISLAREMLGFAPRHSFAEGLQRFKEWLLETEDTLPR